MSGSFFMMFWWGIWIIATFFLSKMHKFRFRLALLSLVLIIVFPYKIHFAQISIQLPAIIFLIIGYMYFAYISMSKRLYMMVALLIMTSGYTGALLITLYDPVWVFFDHQIIFAILIFLIAQIIYPKNFYSHLTCTIVGTIQGEIIYGIILSKWEFSYEACSSDFLDTSSIYILITMSWFLIQHISSNLSMKNSIGKQKHG